MSCSCLLRPRLAPFLTTPSAPARGLHALASSSAERRIPTPRAPITTPAALLAASKHKLSQYESKLGDWNELFTKTGSELRDAGMSVQDRRYLLWLLEKYRQGHDIDAVAIAPTPKKKFRGWGPKVQNGKRVR